VRVKGDLANPASLTALLVPAVQKVRVAASKVANANNLKQLSLAMLNYHDVNRTFPPAEVGGGLSWRVALLPYVEEQNLYNQFHLNEPWDSPHNIKLLDKMPKVYAHPSPTPGHQPFTTYYQVFTGPGTPFVNKQAIGIPQITDGTSNTIAIVEAAKSVPWTKPEDLPYNPQGPLPLLGGKFPDGFHVASFDGVVHFLPAAVPQQNLRALITPNGGEPVQWP
jgi:hypothetical protein